MNAGSDVVVVVTFAAGAICVFVDKCELTIVH